MLPLLFHILLVFVGRHWLLGFANAALTAMTGLGLVALGSRWRALRLTAIQRLQLQRGVLLAALAKGALLLVVGEGYPHRSRTFVVPGLQLPGPLELLGLSPRTVHSVWYPSSITARVGLVLLGLAGLTLLRRFAQVWRAERGLDALARCEPSAQPDPEEAERAGRVLGLAARRMGLSAGAALPPVLLADLPCPTPLLLGLRRPRIVLSPGLAGTLTDPELEAALRHELAHFIRRDHLWRWLLTWVTDVGRLTGVAGWLSARAVAAEEDLCDRLAARSAAEALLLAGALTKSVASGTAAPAGGVPAVVVPAVVVPALLGLPSIRRDGPHAIASRLERLLLLADECGNHSEEAPAEPRGIRVSAARAVFGAALFLLVYAKYLLYLNVF